MQQLAALAGVSAMTVSRALRDDPHVLPETKALIRALAEEYGYRPRTTVIRTSLPTLGCILPLVADPFYALVLSSILKFTFRHGYHLFVSETENAPQRTGTELLRMVSHGVSGILIASGNHDPLTRAMLLPVLGKGVPVVGLDMTVAEIPIDIVANQEEEIAATVITYLLRLNHRHIGYLEWASQPDNRRRRAIFQALYQRGLANSPHHQLARQPIGKHPADIYRLFCSGTTLPTAIIAFSDVVAQQFQHLAIQQGLRIPGDFSLISIANVNGSEYFSPPLTTVEQYPGRLGEQATALLIQRINACDDFTTPRQRISIPINLQVRNSCAAPTCTATKRFAALWHE